MFSRIFQQHQQQYISRISPSFSYVSTFSFCFFKYHGSMKTANKTTTTKKDTSEVYIVGIEGEHLFKLSTAEIKCHHLHGWFRLIAVGSRLARSVCNIVAGAFSVHHQSIYKPLEDIFDLIELLGEPDFYSAQTVLFSFIHSSSAHALLLGILLVLWGLSDYELIEFIDEYNYIIDP
ncbi:uncharacterized protein LOC110818803 isoform X1 [Carica papaya]|uniref:uncharacterized protein LOC110818803 isoform X1 n=1 Tax=Carica papaya TaxID=3649 RepID=UPI000B8CDE22|nr:uncharacterized protein LOC110818803 isoform X1 [Carica papaya]